jgi:hypothetical protein
MCVSASTMSFAVPPPAGSMGLKVASKNLSKMSWRIEFIADCAPRPSPAADAFHRHFHLDAFSPPPSMDFDIAS